MKPWRQPWIKALAGTLVVLGLAAALGVSDGLNRIITDGHFRLAAPRAADQPFRDIVIVAIDDKTVARLGRLRYWTRDHYARLLARTGGARVVGIDVLFTEADERDRAGDQAFAAAVARHGRVVLPFYQSSTGGVSQAKSTPELDALLQRYPQLAAADDLTAVYPHTLDLPYRALLQGAAGLGFANVTADQDGVYRRPVLLKSTAEGRLLPQFTLAILATALGRPWEQLVAPDGRKLLLGEGRQASLAEGALWLKPMGRRETAAEQAQRDAGGRVSSDLPGAPIPSISFVDALNADPKTFAEKIVLVGETNTGTTDIRPNPLDSGLRGVELNAEVLANLLAGSGVQPLSQGANWLLIALAVALPLALYAFLPPRTALLGSLVLLAVVLGLMEGLFWLARWVPSWSPVLLGMVASTLLMGQQRLGEEARQKQTLRQEFSAYVAPELVEELVRNPAMAQQEGTRQRVAVLFSDIRSFTTFSEQNPPEQVVRQMQDYLEEMTDAVVVPGGVVDKFIGDAVMALYGPFRPDLTNLSATAVVSALDMLERLERLNQRFGAQGWPRFEIGIGIHIGDAIVGQIGTQQKKQFTALGDTVNLASRLQSATKELHAVLVVSEDVKNEAEPVLGKLVEFRDLGSLTVRNREQPVRVYEARRLPGGPNPSSDGTPEAD